MKDISDDWRGEGLIRAPKTCEHVVSHAQKRAVVLERSAYMRNRIAEFLSTGQKTAGQVAREFGIRDQKSHQHLVALKNQGIARISHFEQYRGTAKRAVWELTYEEK